MFSVSEFEIGDKVICINDENHNSYINYGDIVTILNIERTKYYDLLLFKEIDKIWFSTYKFKRVIDLRKDKINRILYEIHK